MKKATISNLGICAGNFQVKDVSFSLNEGEYLVLMGPTGSGKSLLVKAICGLIPLAEGQIVIDGIDVTRTRPRERHLGYVPQNSALFPHLSVARNLTFALELHGQRAGEALKEVQDIIDALGLAPFLERRTGNLSGGETQKVALGRALASRPKILLLDEPVSALDEPTRAEICEVLHTVHRTFSMTTIHVCHSLVEARAVSDRVAIMAEGRLIRIDPLSDLEADPGDAPIVRRLLGLPPNQFQSKP